MVMSSRFRLKGRTAKPGQPPTPSAPRGRPAAPVSPILRKSLMPSTKKPASSKRASLPREASYETRFAKDWERLSRSGRYNMQQHKEVMMLLIANDAPLGPEWLDHALKGDWRDHSECNFGGQFLLIYT